MRLWTGRPLAELLPELRAELRCTSGRRLPSGAHVALEQRANAVRLWLWREGEPKVQDWRPRWEREVATFLRHLGCEGWRRVPDKDHELHSHAVGLFPMVAAFDEPVTP